MLGKLRYSRWLTQQEIFCLIQYIDSHSHYNCNINVFPKLLNVNMSLAVLLLVYNGKFRLNS